MYFFMYLRIFLSNGAAMYFFTYSRGDMSIMPVYMAISSIVNIVAALLAPRLAKRFGKRWLTIASVAVCVAAYGGLYAARTAGVAVFLTMAMITWLSGSVPYALIWAFVADITDETERRRASGPTDPLLGDQLCKQIFRGHLRLCERRCAGRHRLWQTRPRARWPCLASMLPCLSCPRCAWWAW